MNRAGDDPTWETRLRQLDDELEALGANAEHDPAEEPAPTAPASAAADDTPASARDAAGDGAASPDAVAVAADPPVAAGDPAPAAANGDGKADEDEDEISPAARRRRAILDWVYVIGVALLVAFLIRTFVLAHFVVDGHSMVSTLHDGDRVFVNKLSYRLHDPNRGDVVVLHELGGTSERDLIKRVIGLPGETVAIHNCQVTIDGGQLIEPYLDPAAMDPETCNGEMADTTVPAGHVFVLGDNRGNSTDSRVLGPIPEGELVGRAFVVFWPLDDWAWL